MKQRNENGEQPENNTPQIILTQEELKRAEEYYLTIHMSDSTSIMEYGSDIQKKLSELSGRILSNLNSQNMDHISNVINTTIQYLNSLETDTNKSFLSSKKKRISIRELYKNAEKNIDRLTTTLQQQQIQLMKDSAMLSQLYHMNTVYYRELNVLIAAGKKKLEYCEQTELVQLEENARKSSLPQDAQSLADLRNQMERLSKKLHELELTGSVALQSAPLIKLVQSNQTSMASKLQSILHNTIPLWKNQVVLALGTEHSKQTALMEQQTNDMVNKLLLKNSETIKLASLETIQSANRTFMDMATLNTTNKQLIQSLNTVVHKAQESE